MGRIATLSLLIVTLVIAAGCTSDMPVGEDSNSPGTGQLPEEPNWTALYEQELAQFAHVLREQGVEPPNDVDFVRFISPDEHGRVHAECIREQGFDAEESFDGGVSYGPIPADQAGAQQQAMYRCQVQYPVHPRYTQPLTDEQVRVIYEHFVEVLVGCLTSEGYEVPAAPTWESFLADYHRPGGAWHPYDVVEPTSEAEWQRINEKCPQTPPLEDLYGPAG